MRIIKVNVGKGRGIELEPGKWERVSFEVEVQLEFESELETAKQKMLEVIDNWLGTPASMTVQQAEPFDGLPWITYRIRKPCNIDDPGWCHRNAEGAKDLVARLNPSGKWTRIGRWEFRLSGQGFSLINRRRFKGTL